MATSRLAEIIEKDESELLSEWKEHQSRSNARDRVSQSELNVNSHDFLIGLRQGLENGSVNDIQGPAWSSLRDMLANLSRERASQGFSPVETATFVLSFKKPLFNRLRTAYQSDTQGFADDVWTATQLFDELGLFTTDVFQKTRETVILRQQQEMLELSTPVVELWKGILALPLIGTLDSSRTQIVMQNLLEAIVSKEAHLAIIDITGVPTVDTLVAQHLLKAVAAARLMGAECIISGIRPQIAQTIIHLGVDLGTVITKANLADAFRLALQKRSLTVCKV
jgi:rsbT co-antagonist protein RsbR